MIQVENLVKKYGSFVAVNDVSFDVAAGEVFGFLGPNGAGKTTSMRIIAGLIRPSSGNITLDGHDLQKDAIKAKEITSFIPDRPYLYEKLTAKEFLLFVGGLHRMNQTDVLTRGEALLAQFGLAQWADTLIDNYSHGMKQRLVFSGALLPRPKLLVVDEPMVGLDPKGARLVKDVFRELCSQDGLTVFVSTHTMEVAEEVCDRIGIIHQGQLVSLGTMEELRGQAGLPGSRLEDIFLQLTDETTEESEPSH